MAFEDTAPQLTDIVDGMLAGPEWDQWLAAHPTEAAEVEVARRVRGLMRQLAKTDIVLPEDFEARLLARIRDDRTLLDMLDLFVADMGGALIELINLLLSLLPAPPPQPATT
jgi:hypothetical protein